MGRLLITNVPAWDSELREAYAAGGFRESAHFEEAGCRVTAYKKLKINNCNTYEKDGNFVATAGTLIYKELFGREALEQLLSDAENMSVTELRRNMIGSFVAAVKTGKTVRIFVDETHTYSVHYYSDGDRYLLTNLFYHIEKCARQKVHEDAFLERCTRGGATIGKQSPFHNIFKLCAKDVAHIDLETGAFRLDQCELNDYSCSFSGKEEAAQCLFERIKELSRVRSKHIRSTQLFLTGGMDSRLELAIELYNNDHVRAAYWKGSDVISNGTDEDTAIAKELAGKNGIPFTLYDISESFDDALAHVMRDKCNKYGEYTCTYASNSKWFKMFEELDGVDSLEFGFSDTILKDLSDLDASYREPYSLRDFVHDVFCRTNIEKYYLTTPNIYNYIENDICTAIQVPNRDVLDKTTAFNIFTYSRLNTDFGWYNLANMFVYAFPLLVQKPVMDANSTIPYEWRKGNYFSVMMTKLFKPELVEFPYYSHHHIVEYDPVSDTVHDARSFVLKNKVKQMIFNGVLWDIYLQYFQKILRPRAKYNDAIFERCKQFVRQSKTVAKTALTPVDAKNWRGLNIDDMATVVAQIAVMDTLDVDG